MMKKVKVLEITHGLAPGGIESFVLNIFDSINKENIEIDFCVACEGKQFYEDYITDNGANLYRTSDLNGIKNIIKHFFKLIHLLKTCGPFDVVHTHIDFFNGVNVLAAWVSGVPIRISHAHNTNSANAEKSKVSIGIKIYRFIMRATINLFATHRLGCSELANKYMYGSVDRTKVICNAIHMDRFFYTNKEKKKKNINLITIGRMCEQKNSVFIIDIVNELLKIRNDFKLYYIGDGPLKEKILEKIEQNGLQDYVVLLGNQKDIYMILREMDYFLLPSRWEGLPVSLIEAQSAGLVSFISDKITKEADLGMCMTISLNCSAYQWAVKIHNYINSEECYQIDEAIAKKFDVKNMIQEIESIYQEKM